MMNETLLLIRALLEKQSEEAIKKQIDALQDYCNSKSLRLKLDIDNAEFKTFTANLEKISQQISKSMNFDSTIVQLDQATQKWERLAGESEKQAQATQKGLNALGQMVTITDKLDKETGDTVKTTIKLADNYEKIRKEQEKLNKIEIKNEAQYRDYTAQQESQYTADYQQSLNSILGIKEKINLTDKQRFDYEQMYLGLLDKEEKQIKDLELFRQKYLGGEGVKGQLDIFADKYKGQYDKNDLESLRQQMDALNKVTPETKDKMQKLGIQFQSLQKSAAQSGSVLTRSVENLVKFMRYYLVAGGVVKVFNEIKDGVKTVIELDKSLTELNKVADLTNSQLDAITKRAYDAGTTIGRTGKEVIDATSEWVRAGYNIEEALQLSQQSLLLTNIGDGIDNVKEASSSLIAILKGFKMEASDTARVVDILNEVSNNYAVDTNNLTEILKRTSGTIAQTGTSYEQLIGLATGGFESLRNAEMVASGINMISQRLRGEYAPYVQKCA